MILSDNFKIRRDALKRQPRLFLLLVLLYMYSIISFLLIIFRFCLTRSIKGSRAAVQHCWLKLKHLKCNKKNSSSNTQHGVLQQQNSFNVEDNVHKKKTKVRGVGE